MNFASIIYEAYRHAETCQPNESCGILTGSEYIQCENIHSDPLNNFEINENQYFKYIDTAKMIIHSHTNNRHASEEDMIGQMRTGIPWGIINVVCGRAIEINILGGIKKHLYGRKFVNGISDCFSFCIDFYDENYNIKLNNYPHSINFWTKGKDIIIENFEKEGFSKSDDMLPGDILIFKMGDSKVANHTAIYLGHGLMGHHMAGKLSRKDPVKPFENSIVCVVRHKDMHA